MNYLFFVAVTVKGIIVTVLKWYVEKMKMRGYEDEDRSFLF